MRTSEYVFAIALCAASPLVLAQSHDPRASVQVATVGAPDTHEDTTDDHIAASSDKQRSAFGQAIAELARALREENAGKARAAQAQGQPAQSQTMMAPRGPTDAPRGDDAGTNVPQVAVQSEREF